MSNFPGMRWSPSGEARVFDAAHEVPEGWSDKHPHDPNFVKPEPVAPPAKAPEPQLDMTRDEIKAALDEGGISWAKNAKTETLYAQLVAAAKAVLTAREVAFDDGAGARALLELAKAPPAA